MNNKKKICFIVAVPGTAQSFLKCHLTKLSEFNEIYLVADITKQEEINGLDIKAYKSIKISRGISLVNDFRALFQLYKYFCKMQFDIVHSITPKAGLLTAIAAYFAKIPNRLHIFTGQVWATKTGIFRRMLILLDKVIVKLDTLIMVDGNSQKDFLMQTGVLKSNQGLVVGSGSISGVDLTRFIPHEKIRLQVRKELNLSENQIVFSYLGRLNADKGISELLSAFNRLCENDNNGFLLFVGIDEQKMLDTVSNYPNIQPNRNFLFYGKTSQPEKVLQASDVFCLPSYREGFGTSVIEASALGIPVICSDTYGVQDAMIDNVTGLRCKTKDVESLYQCMNQLAQDRNLRVYLGKNGKKRVQEEFSAEIISDAWLKLYKSF